MSSGNKVIVNKVNKLYDDSTRMKQFVNSVVKNPFKFFILSKNIECWMCSIIEWNDFEKNLIKYDI